MPTTRWCVWAGRLVVIDSGGRAHAQGRTRRRDGRPHCRPAGAPDEPGLRKLTATIKKTNCMVIFINQIRMKIGVMFGNPETTTGGNALKFYASVRLTSAAPATSRRAKRSSAARPRSRSSRTRSARPSRPPSSTSLRRRHQPRRRDRRHGRGAQTSSKSPAPGTPTTARRSARARDNAREFLKENPEVAREIENKIRVKRWASRRWNPAAGEEA